jgi:branched-chain amino acid transport system ATP-binding protein
MRFSGLVALNQVNLAVKEGSITALIGPNGAGKTTLFNCLTGFYQPTHGDMFFHTGKHTLNISHILGKPFSLDALVKPWRLYEYFHSHWFGGSYLASHAGIARTFQNIRLFREMTVMENLMVAQHAFVNRNILSGLLNIKSYQQSEIQAQETAFQWLDKFHLKADANRLAGELPYGKQRHLEIARAMCTRPKLLCLDEPAAGLNPHETDELSGLILDLRQNHGVTVLLIEHDMSLVMKISEHIVVLDHGVVISEGNVAKIRSDQKVIEAYLGIEHGA